MTVTAASPVVDTKKTTTGATFTKDILENIPTARDPWQIIGMTPGVQAGLNVGGSSSGPAGRPVGLRHERQRAVEPRRRIDHRPVVELLAVVLQLRLVRADPGDDRRRRRLRAVGRPVDQPGDQERQRTCSRARALGTFENDAMQGEQRHRGAVLRGHDAASCRATRSRRSPTTRSSTAGRSSRTGCGGGRRPTSRTSTPASSTSSIASQGELCQT